MVTEIFGALSALAFVLAVLALLAWAVKRFGLVPGQPHIKSGNKKINIIESRILDGKNRLVTIEWNGKEYLLATNASGVTPISVSKPDFQKMVDECDKKHETS